MEPRLKMQNSAILDNHGHGYCVCVVYTHGGSVNSAAA